MNDAAARALQRFLALTETTLEPHVADRAVTLHCLASHAPAFFEEHQLQSKLDEALDRLSTIPAAFPADLPWEVVMARLDALYFRALYGLPNPELPTADIRAACARVTQGSLLAGWLVCELAGALGVDVEVPDASSLTAGERTYWRTHQVLLWTCYLRDPLDLDVAKEALDELQRSLPTRLLFAQWDPAAEMIFCLQAGGREVAAEHLETLSHQQQPDGRFSDSEDADEREIAHCTAVCLIALAGAAQGKQVPPTV